MRALKTFTRHNHLSPQEKNIQQRLLKAVQVKDAQVNGVQVEGVQVEGVQVEGVQVEGVQDEEVDKVLEGLEPAVFKAIMLTPTPLNPSSKALFKTTILHIAARRGNTAAINSLMKGLKELLPRDKNTVLDTQDGGGKSALHVAIEEGHSEVAKRLIQDNAKIDIQDSMGQTPLHVAVIRNKNDIVLSLLGLDVLNDTTSQNTAHVMIMQDSTGKTVLHHASMTGKRQLVILLLAAADSTGKDLLNELLNKKDRKDRSALFHAAQKGHSLIVWLLAQELEAPLSGLVDMDGKTPLHWAAEEGRESTVNAILAAVAVELVSKRKVASTTTQPIGASNQPSVASYVNERSKEGLTALDLAISKIDPKTDNINIITSLLKYGGKPASKGLDQLNSLQRAYFSNNQKVIKAMEEADKTPAEAPKSEEKLEQTIKVLIEEHKEAIGELKAQIESPQQNTLDKQNKNAERIQKVLKVLDAMERKLADTKQKTAERALPGRERQ